MKKLVPTEDIQYLAQQSSGRLNMIVAGMTELINSNAEKTAMLENQDWFQRMINSITGKNKATKEEIQRNHDKINLYVSQALSELYEQQCIDRKIMMSLGNQLNEMYADHLQLKQMLGLFVCKLNEKIENVDHFHILNTEIEQGVYNSNSNLTSVCNILSQLDNRSIKDKRKLDIIQRSMEQQNILNDDEKSLGDYLVETAEISIDNVGLIYSEMNTIRSNFIANLIADTIEAYHFLPDTLRRMKNKKSIVTTVISQEQFEIDAPLSTNFIWQELINAKIEMVNGLLPISKDQFGREIAEAEKLYLQGKFDEAFAMFQTLAEKGNERAYYFMVEYYGNGYGSAPLDNNLSNEWRAKCELSKDTLARVEATYTKSVKTGEFERAVSEVIDDLIKMADDGDPFACFEIYGLVDNGYDGIDYERAEQYAKIAHNKGHWEVMNSLGYHYSKLEQYQKANEYFKVGSKIASPYAQYNLACNYESGRGIEQNDELAFELYKSSAEKGCVFAQNTLGNWYWNGHYVNQDYEEAANWYSKAAHKNYAEAQNALGNYYYNGNGVEQNYEEAVKWYEKAVKQKHAWAQNNLGNCYYNGIGVNQNYKKAADLYRQSAEQGNSSAMNNLGFRYRYGEGVEKDCKKAIEWFQKAIDAGNNRGLYNIGCVYANNYDGDEYIDKAIEYLKRALDLEIYDALNELGFCYLKKGDKDKAFEYHMQLAQRGNVRAEERIAEAYDNIFSMYGCKHDERKAEEWYRRAAKHGSKSAKKYLAKLEEKRNAEIRQTREETKQLLSEIDRQIDNFGKSPWDRFWSNF